MGLYDRNYYQAESQFRSTGADRSAVITLIIINVIVFFADAFTPPVSQEPVQHWLASFLGLPSDVIPRIWNVWRALTYGFVHSPMDGSRGVWHIFWNMFGLWMFGRYVERVYGRREFTWVYLALIVFSGLVWALLQQLTGQAATLVGASGAVSGIVMLFIFHFPNERLILFPIPIPVRAWVLGVLYIGMNLMGALSGGTHDNVAYTAHLAGAAMAFLYFRSGIRISQLVPGNLSWPKWKSLLPRRNTTRLRIHDPGGRSVHNERQADAVLDKVHREGAESLTAQERKVLEEYSRRMRQKHR